MFSRVIYLLTVIDTVLISVFYYKLAGLSPEAYLASGHYTSFGFWVDYGTFMFFIFINPYLHYGRYKFESEFSKAFNSNNQIQLKIARVSFCNILPFAILIGFLVFCVRYWP